MPLLSVFGELLEVPWTLNSEIDERYDVLVQVHVTSPSGHLLRMKRL